MGVVNNGMDLVNIEEFIRMWESYKLNFTQESDKMAHLLTNFYF